MKVQYQLQGTFHRLRLTGTDSIPVSLVDVIREIQAIATQNRTRTPQILRQSFGLNFLPKPVLINLLKQAQGVLKESELYQVSSLRLLHSVESQLDTQVANTYCYQFISPTASLNLAPDNPQIPVWVGSDSEREGIYTVILEQPHYPGLSNSFAENIWESAVNYWQAVADTEKIHLALQSFDQNNFFILNPQYPELKIWIAREDLSLDLRAAITYLRLSESDPSALSQPAQLLVQHYQNQYHRVPIVNLPDEISPDQTLSPGYRFIIGRRNSRSVLETIISTARQFLLISSYIIEDESLTELICNQSQNLPLGVWILTDLRNEVIDRIDTQTSNNVSSPRNYQRSDERKIICLRKLLNANIPIRSGAFHLKTYISEQYAYLGSANLTGGSLDFNIEAGIVTRNYGTHQQLIYLFRQFWRTHSRDEVIPDSNCDGFRLRSIHRFADDKYDNYPSLLTPNQYKIDLIEQLSNFQGQVKIYSRSFQPSPEIAAYLRLLDTQIFVDSQIAVNQPEFNIRKTNNLHAKITLLGNEVAYIGGINFNFSSSALSLNDLMYKTTNRQEINQLIENLNSLNF
jgi:phosphatidylserine/phosphatidylglycerophosphate/cardiolipin synthase-like enzyme